MSAFRPDYPYTSERPVRTLTAPVEQTCRINTARLKRRAAMRSWLVHSRRLAAHAPRACADCDFAHCIGVQSTNLTVTCTSEIAGGRLCVIPLTATSPTQRLCGVTCTTPAN